MKSYTWYLQVFFHLVQLSAVQSYILHNELHPDAKLTQNKFLESLIEGLIGGRTYTQKRGRPFLEGVTTAKPERREAVKMDQAQVIQAQMSNN